MLTDTSDAVSSSLFVSTLTHFYQSNLMQLFEQGCVIHGALWRQAYFAHLTMLQLLRSNDATLCSQLSYLHLHTGSRTLQESGSVIVSFRGQQMVEHGIMSIKRFLTFVSGMSYSCTEDTSHPFIVIYSWLTRGYLYFIIITLYTTLTVMKH